MGLEEIVAREIRGPLQSMFLASLVRELGATPTRYRGPNKRQWSVPRIWRKIVKKAERQGKGVYDVLICNHAVPADLSHVMRKFRPCTECRITAQQYVERHQAAMKELARDG